jgi:peroxiredoxin
MIPHERSLVEKLKDQPFALIGMNSDPKETLRKAMASEKITWRSFWDGGSTGGPIATRWNVHSWPTIYVVDQNGVIRARDLRDDALEKKVEELLAAAKSPAAKPAGADGSGGQ